MKRKQTTEMAKTVMEKDFMEHYPDKDILPSVKKGTSLTGDNFWKGLYGHVTAKYIADYYKTPDPYSTELYEIRSE